MLLETLWFFLPAFVANQFPGHGARWNVPGQFPISRRWLGENKTWAAYYMAALASAFTFLCEQAMTDLNVLWGWYVSSNPLESIWIGALFGIGAVFGDHVKSFVKRRLGIASGAMWWPFDQLDYVFGALLFVYPVSGWIGWEQFWILITVALVGHLIVNWIGYKIGHRKTWW